MAVVLRRGVRTLRGVYGVETDRVLYVVLRGSNDEVRLHGVDDIEGRGGNDGRDDIDRDDRDVILGGELRLGNLDNGLKEPQHKDSCRLQRAFHY